MAIMSDAEIRERLAGQEAIYLREARKAGQPEAWIFDIRTWSDAQLDALKQHFDDAEATRLAGGRPTKARSCNDFERILGQLRDRPLPRFTGPKHRLGTRIDAPEEWKEGMPLGIWWGR